MKGVQAEYETEVCRIGDGGSKAEAQAELAGCCADFVEGLACLKLGALRQLLDEVLDAGEALLRFVEGIEGVELA